MGSFIQIAAVIAAVFAVAISGSRDLRADAAPATCAKQDFESVVEEAAGILRDLNAKNRPAFQEKLRELKDKRKWTHDEFIERAKPFVRDDKTVVFDQSTDELLSAIASMGQEGATAAKPDCAVLLELRARMKVLVDTQTAKWAYMFQKIDAELANDRPNDGPKEIH
jgi:hypothetical protein